MTGKGVIRSVKNYTKGYSDVQIKVREATSNDAWGPSGTIMNEIAQHTHNQADFVEIMDMIDRRLNDKGKNWRHVFKALLVLDYCIHVGSDNVVLYAKENIYVVRTLKEFQHIDENGTDVGANVRQKAKDITNLLKDDERLRAERRTRDDMRHRMITVGDHMNETILSSQRYQRPKYLDEDSDMRRAIEESKRLALQEAQKRAQGDEDLAKALQLSEEEAREKERKQREKLERENSQNLFGNSQDLFTSQPPTNQAFNPAYNSNAMFQQQQQPLNTGMTFTSFSDPVAANSQNPYGALYQGGLQAQMTGMPLQSQFTGMAPFQTNQTHYQPQQQQPSPSLFSSTPTGGQSYQTGMKTGNNPFSQLQSTQTSNQPSTQQFLPQSSSYGSVPNTTTVPSLNTTFISTPNTPQSSHLTAPRSPLDDHRSKLNAMLGNREDGMDTFGNTGNLRIPMGTGFANSLKYEDKKAITNDLLDFGTNSQSSSSPSTRNPYGASSSAPNQNAQWQSQQQQSTGVQLNFGSPQLNQPQASFGQHTPMQPQSTGFVQMQQPQMTGFGQQPMQPQMTGYGQPAAVQYPQTTGYTQTTPSFQSQQVPQQQQQPFGQPGHSFGQMNQGNQGSLI